MNESGRKNPIATLLCSVPFVAIIVDDVADLSRPSTLNGRALTFTKIVGRLCQTLIERTLLTSWDVPRFTARADQKLTAFLDLEFAVYASAELV